MGTDLVVRFAGEGGQGQVTAAEGLAQAAARVGYHVQTFATYPSQIEGGPVWAQTRVSTNKILTQGDQLDVLVALNRQAYETHIADLRTGGVLIYNSRDFDTEPPGNVIGLDAEGLARETGNPRAANIIMIGAVAELASMSAGYFEDWIKERFARGRPNDAEIIGGNVKALEVGIQAARASGYSVESLDEPSPIERQRILVNGNNFLALGALAAGLETFYGYPISPATTILVYMESNLNGPDSFVGQASSEIESIAAIIGAGYAGRKAMTSTAGPGLSLMGEGLGLAWMAEIPCVVVDVQRGGPATGLPTKTEQSDLYAALNPGHGDMRIPVIAPGSVAECFQAGVDALNWAERYQGPVILLTARGSEVDRVLGLELGADDYVVKPFSPRELVARVRARLRRSAQDAQARWQRIGGFEVDREGRRLRYRGRMLDLTRYEYGLLEALLSRPGAVWSRARLMDRVWQDVLDSSDRTVDTHIKTLRAKLRAAAGADDEDPIRTHRGVGYSLDTDE